MEKNYVSYTEPELDALELPSAKSQLSLLIRAKLASITKRNLPERVCEQLLAAYVGNNRTTIRKILTAHGAAPDPTSEQLEPMLSLPIRYTKLREGVNETNCGYHVFATQSNTPVAVPHIQPYTLEGSDVPVTELFADNPGLTGQKLSELEQYYAEFLEAGRYNNLGHLCEFIEFVREARVQNPQLSIAQVHALFTADPMRNALGYKGDGTFGGSCIEHAYLFVEELKHMGFKARVVTQKKKIFSLMVRL